MPRTITVTIEVSADATHDIAVWTEDASPQPVETTVTLAIPADSEADAIVTALRKAADVTANRFGRPDLINMPEGVAALVGEMMTANSGLSVRWAKALLNEYGMELREQPCPSA